MSSFGEDLKRERELRGFSLREISNETKINLRFLEALENNDFEHLPGGQFNKGFIRAYANYIGIDPEKMVNSYLLELSRQEESKRPFPQFITPAQKKKRNKWAVPISIIIILIVIIILLTIFLRSCSAHDRVTLRKEVQIRETKISNRENLKGEKVEKMTGRKKEKGPSSLSGLRTPQKIMLTVHVLKSAKLIAQCDGSELINKVLLPGEERTLVCDKELTLTLSETEAFHIYSGNQKLHFPETSSTKPQKLKITPDNLERYYGNE